MIKLKVLSALAFVLLACRIGIADQSEVQQPEESGIDRMFLNAHAPDQQPRYRNSEIRKMIRDAKTPEDFVRLADYFDYRSMKFEQKSQEELAELQRLLALPYHARSYAAQVDNARSLIKRYRVQAQECSVRADIYREQSAPGNGNK